MQSRPSQVSPKSKFRDGSSGSKIETENPRIYPETSPSVSDVMCGSRGHETREAHGRENPKMPKETDHPFSSLEVVDNRIHEDSPEMVRRKNNRSRDKRCGYRITDDTVYPSS